MTNKIRHRQVTWHSRAGVRLAIYGLSMVLANASAFAGIDEGYTQVGTKLAHEAQFKFGLASLCNGKHGHAGAFSMKRHAMAKEECRKTCHYANSKSRLPNILLVLRYLICYVCSAIMLSIYCWVD